MATPTFQRIDCNSLNRGRRFNLCLFVDYSDKADDVLLLRQTSGDTIFEGRLLKENTRVCAIINDASEPDNMEVRAISFILRIELIIAHSKSIYYNDFNIHL